MSRALLLVGLGGCLGSIARYAVALFFVRQLPSSFPYGTFAVNMIGCFLIGLFYGLSEQYGWFSPQWRIFLATGFCGGFTTFSSFSYENLKLLQDSEYLMFGLYSFGSFLLGIIAVFGGLILVKWLSA